LSSVRAITDIRVDAYETTSAAPATVGEGEDDIVSFFSDVDLDLQKVEDNGGGDGDSSDHGQWVQDASAEDYDMSDFE